MKHFPDYSTVTDILQDTSLESKGLAIQAFVCCNIHEVKARHFWLLEIHNRKPIWIFDSLEGVMPITQDAELSALLSSGELAHSPAGWVTLNTLNAYTGRAVPGNFDPQSQTVVDSKPFTLTHQSTPLKLDDHLLQAIVAIDDKNRRRFQIGSHSVSGRKELVIRLTPPAPRSWIGAAPPQSSPTYIPPPTLRPTSPYAAYFCLPHMIKVLISPLTPPNLPIL